MCYSLSVFCFYYKIIGLSLKNLVGRRLAGRGLTRLAREYGPGLGLKRACRVGPGPNINSLGWAWAYILVCGPGPGLTNFCGPGLDSNC